MAGLPWIPLDVAFPTSRKAIALGIALQEPLAWAYVVRLWTWAAQNAADGIVEGPDAVGVIEQASGWVTRPGELVAAMSLPHVRLLDETSAGFGIHDWAQHCGAHVEKREKERTRLRTYRKRTRTERVQNKYVHGESKRESKRESKLEAVPAEAAPEPEVWEHFRDLLADRMAVPRDWLKVASADRVAEVRGQVSAEVERLGMARALEVAAESATKAKNKPRWLSYFVGALQDARRNASSQDDWQDAPRSSEWRDEQGRTLREIQAADQLAAGGTP